ncbi:polysaccharide deacetylase family protein [Chloroflexota bacterium]
MINALTIDLEFWHSAELVGKYAHHAGSNQIKEAAIPILELLDKYGIKGTFFALGEVAEQYPELVKLLHEKGHEIGCHGYSHRRLHELGKEEFEKEVIKSVNLLYTITGEKPIGFRAPTFSLDNSTSWALEVLVKHGFKYDSSICPVKTGLYGISGAPFYPYKPSFQDITTPDPDGKLVEFPVTTTRLVSMNIPISGGFYLRVLPFWFLRWAVKRVNQISPAMIYLHPWEVFPGTPRIKGLPIWSRFITYFGINHGLRKFEHLLMEFQFKPMRDVLQLDGANG